MDMKNEIIEAECREVYTPEGSLCEITAEILQITEMVNRTAIMGIIEIGKRFEKAKALVKHGEWGKWCEDCTGYSQSMAENYIKVYKEYGSEQLSLFGDLSKSQSIGNLGITKLIELTAIPADEREAFVEENNITTDTTVKELQEIIRKTKSELQAAESKSELKEKELRLSIEQSEAAIEEKDEEIRRLQAELDRRNEEAPTVPQDEVEKMMAEADEAAKKKLQSEINRLKKENKKAATDTEDLKKKLETLQGKYDKQATTVKELKTKNTVAEAENEQMKQTIERLQKESSLGSNEKIVKLNFCFEETQNSLNSLKQSLEAVKDSDGYDKLYDAVMTKISEMVSEM